VSRPRRAKRTLRSTAFAPGHVTGFFTPDLDARDPRARGSTGAGLVLELGVVAHAEWQPATVRRVSVVADIDGPLPISEEVARRLAPAGPGHLSVHLAHQLPVGQGFGMSAAGALSTALAVAALSGSSRAKAVEVAHLAELFGGGGLGGVAAILGGGLEFRARAGVPPFGLIFHRPFRRSLILGVVGGPLPSPRILRNRKTLVEIGTAFEAAWGTERVPGAEEFLDASERFTDRLHLTTPALERTLRSVRSAGGWAAQAMFGRSFFAVPRSQDARRRIVRDLARRNVLALDLSTARQGAVRRRGSG
jgi:pantoate kinase